MSNQNETMFKKIRGNKKKKYNTNINKAMRIPDVIFQTNDKLFVTINPKNACKLEFAVNLQLLFIDQPQPDVVVFEIINFQIHKILVTYWKHGIGNNDIITFNEELKKSQLQLQN